MNDILVVNSLEAFQNLDEDVHSLFVLEYFVGHAVLVGVEITILAVLHYQENGLSLYMGQSLHMKVFSSLTMLGWRNEYIELIS